jgi:hypothetical protein
MLSKVAAGRVTVPEGWAAQFEQERAAAAAEDSTSSSSSASSLRKPSGEVDYNALIRAVEAMDPEQFATADLDQLIAQYSR